MPWYTFREGPVFFIVLDGGEDKPDTDIEYSGLNRMDSYREEEARWLQSVVDSEEYKAAPYHVVLVHVPPVLDTWHGPLHANRLFLPILNRAGVDVMLCAHWHSHKFVPAGSLEASFPILVNSNTDALDITADPRSMEIAVRDSGGKERLHLSYKGKK